MGRSDLTIVRATNSRVLAAVSRPDDPALYLQKYLPRDIRPLDTITLPFERPAHAPGALAGIVGAMPHHYCNRVVAMPRRYPGVALSQPWQEPEGSALLVPSAATWELTLRRNMQGALLLDPHELPVPASGSQLLRAAQAILENAQREALLRIAFHWAFACDVSHLSHLSASPALLQHSLSAPVENLGRIEGAGDRLVVPQAVRLVAIAAASQASAAPVGKEFRYESVPTPLKTLVNEYFPSFVEATPPTPAEIRTALWLLSFESVFEDVAEEPLPRLMAHTFGKQSVGEPHNDLARWLNLVNMRDDHPYRAWDPKAAPSNLRGALCLTGDLDLRYVAQLARQVLPTLIASQHAANQLWTIPALVGATAGHEVLVLAAAWQFLVTNLVRETSELTGPRGPGANAPDLGDIAGDPIPIRKEIERWLIERPILRFDDGVIIPIGLPETVHGVISAIETSAGREARDGKKRQLAANILGGCFQAYVTELAHAVDDRHRILGDDVIDLASPPGEKRGDLVIADPDGLYLVIEATRRSLRGDIRYGDKEALERWAGEHLGKLGQAQATASSLHKATANASWAPPRESTCLVVCDLPLLPTMGLQEVFRQISGLRHPPFICSISEYELLIAFGQRGFSVPSLVMAWQQGRRDIPLGHFLSGWPSH